MEPVKDDIDPDVLNRILDLIKDRTASSAANLTALAKKYTPPNNPEPIIFKMFDQPPQNEGLAVLWSYRLILLGVDTVVDELSKSGDFKEASSLMGRDIGNLTGSSNPMSKKSLERIITKSPPNWRPIKQTLNELEDEVKKHFPGSNDVLQLVVWMMLKDLANTMMEIHAVAAAHYHDDKSPEEQ